MLGLDAGCWGLDAAAKLADNAIVPSPGITDL
jgi:hypothetical protein